MPQSLARIVVHLVFSTKNREPLLTPEFQARTFEYLGGALNGIGCPVIKVGGVADHVHLLFVLGRPISVSEVVEEVKSSHRNGPRNILALGSIGRTVTAPFRLVRQT
jgi:putative transposase